MNRYNISTPEGTRDLLFASCRALRKAENAIRATLEDKGYSEIITPAVEYYDVFAQANPELDQDTMLKIVDKSGRICVARPDNTTPIARIAATRLDDAALPVRLYYSQKVFRSVSGGHGHKGEFLQIGAELIGADGLPADLDSLTAARAALGSTGAETFRNELGQAEIYTARLEALGVDAATAESIRRLIENKSFAALGDVLTPYHNRPEAKALYAMPQLFGGIEVLDEVEVLTGNVRVLGAIAYLRRLYAALDEAGFGGSVMIDLGLVHEMDYYTGIMFRGYCGGAGAAILAGGRYNALCAKFGKDMPAGGFGIDVESVAESLAGNVPETASARRDSVRIALTKGRLEKKTLTLLKASGYDISELEAGSRKLISRCRAQRSKLCSPRRQTSLLMSSTACATWAWSARIPSWKRAEDFTKWSTSALANAGLPWLRRKASRVTGITKPRSLRPSTPTLPRHFSIRRIWMWRPLRLKARWSLRPCSSWRTPLWISWRPARPSAKTGSR